MIAGIREFLKKKKQKKYLIRNKFKMNIKNTKVVLYSLIALCFMALTFFVDWVFIIGALILLYLNQKELMKRKLVNLAKSRRCGVN